MTGHVDHPLVGRERVPIERARGRLSAYVYGDILVLAAILTIKPDPRGWDAVIAVAATTLTTYVAHIVAHTIGERIGRTGEAAGLHLREELRDAAPIAIAGLIPAAVLVLAAIQVLDVRPAQLIAAGVVVLRLAFVGVVSSRLTGERAPVGTIGVGVVLAVIGTVVAVLEAVLLH
ncbi:hypothetical protein [uncultured Amnibacterium sp.]|uniref:hypothetical protein n=1 Tax=uncultured Amnibacterium sp. TaxID=1631851 RepID=UPI0035CB3C1B